MWLCGFAFTVLLLVLFVLWLVGGIDSACIALLVGVFRWFGCCLVCYLIGIVGGLN